MSNNFDWNSMLGAGGQTPAPAPTPEPEKQPDPAPRAQDDANALLNAETQQAIRESTEKAKAATKAAAVGAFHCVKRLAHVIRLRVSTARLERTNRRLDRQSARVEGAPAPRVAKIWIYSALAIALIGGLGGGAWLYLRKPHSAPPTHTHSEVKPSPTPVAAPASVEPVADPIADLDEPAAQATPQPSAPAPQAKATATAVEVAKPLPPKPRPKAEHRTNEHHQPTKTSDDHAQWQDKANADLDSFFNQTN